MEKRSCAITVNGNHTDIVILTYSNRTLLIVTQFKKLGTFLTIEHESWKYGDMDTSLDNGIFTTKTVFGDDDEEAHISAICIANRTKIKKPTLLSIAIKEHTSLALEPIVQAINHIKPW